MSVSRAVAAYIRQYSVLINGICLPLIVVGVVGIFSFMLQISGSISAVQSTQTMMQKQFAGQNSTNLAMLDRMRKHDVQQDNQIFDMRDAVRDNTSTIKTLNSRVDRLEKHYEK